jgi:dTDP-4-amino-4,6-dideoxygalactose transaminase
MTAPPPVPANGKNIPLFKVFMSNDVIEPLNNVLQSGFITQGPMVDKFEASLQEYFEHPYVLTLNSATSGLTMGLRLLKDPVNNADKKEDNWPGFDTDQDIVLSPALTCFATNASILANNCKIGWIDVDSETANVSIPDIERKLNAHTKVLYIVHWGGYPVDLDRLKELQEIHLQKYGYKFAIIEDCAHAFGATYKGKKLGNHGNICVYSLQAIKHLTTGDGGLILLPTEKLYDRAKLLRWYGIDRDKRNYKRKDLRMENDILEFGYKFHMNDINATLGLYNLPHMNDLLTKNRSNAKYLHQQLQNHLSTLSQSLCESPSESRCRSFELMENKNDRESSWWLFTMKTQNKERFIEHMKVRGIFTSQVHNRNDINTCVQGFKSNLPELDQLEKTLVCIPVGWWLSQEDLDYIVESIIMGW